VAHGAATEREAHVVAMTRRSDKQDATAFMVAYKPQGEAFAVIDYCDPECNAEGVCVIELFDNKQIAQQFADARGYPAVRKMSIYHAMKAY
jgi:hypothetical protein